MFGRKHETEMENLRGDPASRYEVGGVTGGGARRRGAGWGGGGNRRRPARAPLRGGGNVPSMEGDAFAEAADFFEEGGDILVPEGEVGGLGLGGGFGEEEVGDGEVADGAGAAVGLGVEFPGEAEGGFADLVGGAGVAEDGGVDFVAVDDGGVVAHLRGEGGVLVDPGDGEDDEGIAVGEEEAAVAEVALGGVVKTAFPDAVDLVVAGFDHFAPDHAGICFGVCFELGAEFL